MNSKFLYILAGFLGVLNMVLWGVYGDLAMEDFKLGKVLRTLGIGFVAAIFVYAENSNLPLFLVALIVITFERATTEIYKALIRNEQQDKYLIPSDLNIKGPIWLKRVIGLMLVVGVMVLYWTFSLELSFWFTAIIAGLVAAFFGMAKDAPYEGFQIKFFRSPIVALIVGSGLNYLYPTLNTKYLLFGVWGGERILSECYKKIINGRVAGKFKQVNTPSSWIKERWWVLIPYTVDLVLLGLLMVTTLEI